ncbi:hypothetical protein [Frigoribacterium faeni]|uniref:DUF2076 domain-containing protein n=1 Tax=Frigoribacterium faeni TaxID=145483 RepID=A0A7W3JIF2_9MICO|nr:hypothetical protein [Frigoribacterium faeni]MBA8813413.1 hypothetical protein [Frigoribacterium faeni]BFF14650.1 hypothetical protein GCM10025699_59530 [Microbacterium flavescens]GEK83070.1 hypothetical protein FFA01_13790 [Frigoribacterium faeni]
MGFLDRLLGRDDSTPRPRQQQTVYDQRPYGQQSYDQAPPSRPAAPAPAAPRSDDEIAVERYRYLLRTAPPETIEQVHAEAFQKLTPEQRRLVFDELSAQSASGEQPRGDDPQSLAQAATRSELRQPGTLERTLGGGRQGAAGAPGRGGPGIGSMIGGSLLGTVAGFVIGSALVSAFLPDADATADGGEGDGGDAGADSGDAGADATTADAGGDAGGDFGGGDAFGGGDFGGGFGDFDI